GGLIAVPLGVVGVGGDHVHVVVGLGEDRVLPGAEGLYLRVRGAAGDELEVRILLPHGASRLGGQAGVLLGGLVAGLPGAVHLVAQAPHADAVGLGAAVRGALVGQRDALRGVGVLEHVQRLLDTAGAEVDRVHRLDLGLLRPGHDLVQTHGVRVGGVPGEVVAGRTLLHRAHAVLPAVAGDEVAARVAHGADTELAGQGEDVG